MDTETVLSVVGNLGFPIFMTIMLLRINSDNSKQYFDLYRALTESINTNTKAIEALDGIIEAMVYKRRDGEK